MFNNNQKDYNENRLYIYIWWCRAYMKYNRSLRFALNYNKLINYKEQTWILVKMIRVKME